MRGHQYATEWGRKYNWCYQTHQPERAILLNRFGQLLSLPHPTPRNGGETSDTDGIGGQSIKNGIHTMWCFPLKPNSRLYHRLIRQANNRVITNDISATPIKYDHKCNYRFYINNWRPIYTIHTNIFKCPYDIFLSKLNIIYNVICIILSLTNKYYPKNKY